MNQNQKRTLLMGLLMATFSVFAQKISTLGNGLAAFFESAEINPKNCSSPFVSNNAVLNILASREISDTELELLLIQWKSESWNIVSISRIPFLGKDVNLEFCKNIQIQHVNYVVCKTVYTGSGSVALNPANNIKLFSVSENKINPIDLPLNLTGTIDFMPADKGIALLNSGNHNFHFFEFDGNEWIENETNFFGNSNAIQYVYPATLNENLSLIRYKNFSDNDEKVLLVNHVNKDKIVINTKSNNFLTNDNILPIYWQNKYFIWDNISSKLFEYANENFSMILDLYIANKTIKNVLSTHVQNNQLEMITEVNAARNVTNFNWLEIDPDYTVSSFNLASENTDLANSAPTYISWDKNGFYWINPFSAVHNQQINNIAYVDIGNWTNVTGFCFYDKNNNGLFDFDEKPASETTVEFEGTKHMAVANTQGVFEVALPSENPFSTIAVCSKYYNFKSISKITADRTKPIKLLIPLQMDMVQSGVDMGLDMVSGNGLEVVSEQYIPYNIIVNNNLGTPVKNIKVEVKLDENIIDFLNNSGYKWNYGINNSTIIFEIPIIEANSKINIPIKVKYSKNINLKQNIVIKSTIVSGAAGDIDLSDNSSTITQKVVNFVSEMSKVAYPGADATKPIDSIRYFIYFNNTTGKRVKKVTIVDDLSQINKEISITASRILDYSHKDKNSSNYFANMQYNFVWDNLNLPSYQEDPINCKGYISFLVVLKQKTSSGVVIKNQAKIYFDFYPVTRSNTTVSVFDGSNVASIKNKSIAVFNIYPNPGNGKFIIENFSQTDAFTVRDIHGKIVKQITISKNSSANIDLTNLCKGMYFIQSGNYVVRYISN